MKISKLMITVSVAALLAATPALAQTYDSQSDADRGEAPAMQQSNNPPPDTTFSPGSTTYDNADASDRTDNVPAAENNNTAARSAAAIKADPNVRAAPKKLDERLTAEGMLGNPVYNEKNERVARVEDIILDAEGRATLVVVKDGDFPGMGGKLAAFDYNTIVNRKDDGDVIMPITEKTIDNVAEFTYDRTDKGNVRTIPANGYSVKKILKGDIVDVNGKKLANIKDIAISGGRASYVVAAYNQILNMGGDLAALDFDATQPVVDRNHVNLQLGSLQAQKFKTFQDSQK